MFYCHPVNQDPFKLEKKELSLLRNMMIKIPKYMPLTISKDGGRKYKIGSHSRDLWNINRNIRLIYPALEILFNKVLTPEWLEISFNIVKAQACKKDRNFLKRFHKLGIFIPKTEDISGGILIDTNFLKHESITNKILPWLPSINDEEFKEMQVKEPKTLYVLPRFHFSYMNPGSYILPHLDSTDKLLSMMLYLPSHEQVGSDILSTMFYQGNSSIIKSIENKEYLKKEELIQLQHALEVTRPPFSDRNLIMFSRSNFSWHGVTYPAQINKGTRLSVNINFHLSYLDQNKRLLCS